ncbi:hypothetical protein, partial [Pseudomonas sp. MPR-LB5]
AIPPHIVWYRFLCVHHHRQERALEITESPMEEQACCSMGGGTGWDGAMASKPARPLDLQRYKACTRLAIRRRRSAFRLNS